jgi:hypothetical protein
LLARVQRRFVDGGHGIQGRDLAPVQHPRSLLATGIIFPAQTRTDAHMHRLPHLLLDIGHAPAIDICTLAHSAAHCPRGPEVLKGLKG